MSSTITLTTIAKQKADKDLLINNLVSKLKQVANNVYSISNDELHILNDILTNPNDAYYSTVSSIYKSRDEGIKLLNIAKKVGVDIQLLEDIESLLSDFSRVSLLDYIKSDTIQQLEVENDTVKQERDYIAKQFMQQNNMDYYALQELLKTQVVHKKN